jgi:hypothetical protein
MNQNQIFFMIKEIHLSSILHLNDIKDIFYPKTMIVLLSWVFKMHIRLFASQITSK